MCPGYIKNDPAMLNNPYVREITSREISQDENAHMANQIPSRL